MTQRDLKALIIKQNIEITTKNIFGNAAGEEKLAKPAFEGRQNGLAPNGNIYFGRCVIKKEEGRRGLEDGYSVFINYLNDRRKKRSKKLGEMASVDDAIRLAVSSDFVFDLSRKTR